MKNNTIVGWLAHGNNNRFILFDLLEKPQQYTESFVKQAHKLLVKTERDDVLILMPDHLDKENNHLYLKMIVLEPDNSVAVFCGNGSRVVATYLKKQYDHIYKNFSLVSCYGTHKISYPKKDLYGIQMGTTQYDPFVSKFVKDGSQFVKEQNDLWILPYKHNNKTYKLYFTETVEPHLVCFDPIDDETLTTIGNTLNTKQRNIFPLGINLNAVKTVSDSSINVVTYERGIQHITQSCGTGSTSCVALSNLLNNITQKKCIVHNKGGTLAIHHDSITKQSEMIGPAKLTETISFPLIVE